MNRHTRNSRFATSMTAVALVSCMIEAVGATQVGAPRQPVEYRVKEKSLIGNELHEAGSIVLYAGLPAENLEPLCDEGRARAAEYEQSNKARVTNMIAANQESGVGDPAKFMEAFAKAMAEERAEHTAQMAKMVELQQESALQLAQAAQNMAALAAALTSGQAVPAAPDTAPEATAGEDKPAEKAAGKAKG